MKNAIAVLLTAAMLAACGTTHHASSSGPQLPSQATHMTKKQTVGTFLGAVLQQDVATMRKLANADYIQHNPYIPTGLDPFIQMLPVLKQHGTTAQNIRMFEDGDYVFMHNIWRNAKPFGADEMVSFDIIRLDRNGKVAEHWDAMTPLVKQTASGRTQTDGPTAVEDLAKTAANKALAVSFIEDVLMGKNPGKITDYISAQQYHQHNPDVKDGLSGIVDAMQKLTAQNNMFQYKKIHKVLGEGNFVLSISEGAWGGKPRVFYDLFRVQNGKLVEHWDVIQEIPTQGLANNNSMFGFK